MVRALVAALLCVACQGQGSGGTGSASSAGPVGSSSAAVRRDDASAVIAIVDGGEPAADPEAEPDARTKPDDLEPSDPLAGAGSASGAPGGESARLIAELGAIPAWQAVVDRAQLLARRGQHGVVYGRVGPALMDPAAGAAAVLVPVLTPVVDAGAAADAGAVVDAGVVKSPYVWLIDDTEGNGALGIRIALGDKAKEGDRIAAGGAWQLDTERRWFWKPDTVQALPPAAESDIKDPQPAAPSHAIANAPLAPGARTISVARDGDAVYFQIVGPPPVREGDGWQIADQLGSPVVAVINLPGERASYGGQDMRAADERWQLKRGQIYWVRIGKLRKRAPDKPALVNARTAPIRL